MTSKYDGLPATDDVVVKDPPHRSVCRYCCPAHDELRAEVERLHQQRIRLFDERDSLEAEVERLRAALEKIANTEANIHCSWLIGDARQALGNDKEC